MAKEELYFNREQPVYLCGVCRKIYYDVLTNGQGRKRCPACQSPVMAVDHFRARTLLALVEWEGYKQQPVEIEFGLPSGAVFTARVINTFHMV